MGGFDRVVLGLYTASLAVLSLVSLLASVAWPELVSALEAWMRGTEARIAVAVVSALFFFVSLRLLFTLLRVRRGDPTLVRQGALGEVRVALSAVEGLIAREGRQVEGVRDLKARIVPGDDGLHVEVRAWVSANVRVPELCDRLQQTVRQRVQGVVGAEVGEVRVLVRDIGGEGRRRRVE